MRDYLVYFFYNNKVKTKKLSELLLSCDNHYLSPDVFDTSIGLEFPFVNEDGDYQLDMTVRTFELQVIVNGAQAQVHKISHGDCLIFKNSKGEVVYSILLIDSAHVYLGYKKYMLENNSNYFIGRATENDICFDLNNFISREKHAAIRVDSQGNAYIEDLKRSTGVYVNGRRTNSSQLTLYDELFLMGLSIIYLGDCLAIRNLNLTCRLKEYKGFSLKSPLDFKNEKTNYFFRTTRILKSLDTGVIEIDRPVASQKTKRLPVILTMGPSLTMSIAMLVSLAFSVSNLASGGSIQSIATSGAMAGSMLLGAFMWPMLMNSYQKRQEAADDEFRKAKYHMYISEMEQELAQKYTRNTRVWHEILAPAPDSLGELLDSEKKQLRLWERSVSDEDFLGVRIGIGCRDLGIKIAVPKRGFSLDDDGLYKLPVALAEKYRMLKDVPITLNLREQKTVGLIGKQANIHNITKEIILNIAALHAYDEVKMVFVGREADLTEYDWVKELPHVWSADRGIRYIATNRNEVHEVFNAIDELVKNREVSSNPKALINTPNFVFFLMNSSLTENESLLRYIENSQNNVGISSLFIYGDISKLPKDCSTIIQSDDTREGYYSKNRNNNRFIPFSSETLDIQKLRRFAEKLSSLPLKIDVKNLSIPRSVTFLQIYKAGNIDGLTIEQRWNNNASNKTLAAPIGIRAGGEVFNLDIHEAYHGCHGLVAGMTGSGKSEFLQAFVLSMAINYSPKEVAFVLVDFKGGDMARPFMAKPNAPAMPHLAATISNLSGNTLYRALVSFNAEIKRRQRLFNESATLLGIDKLDINSYHRYFKEGKLKTPLPHLVIVNDEFAQLKTQRPDFLAELVNIAQVGRSLGIHLILATQKPSGVVDPQIWSNSRFRVCLKVLDKQDSSEMINRPDAAMIKYPGRGYVQVGYDEVYECLQSGYSSAEYTPTTCYLPDEEITLHLVDNTSTPIRSARESIGAQKTDTSQLEAIVAKIVALGEQKGLKVRPLWCDAMKEKVLLDELGEPSPDGQGDPALSAVVALADHVKTQQQLPLEINLLKTGHLVLYGAAGTGKTTFIQTLVYSLTANYNPEELNLYALDFGGRSLGYLNILPHSGGVVFSDNENGVVELIDTIQEIIDERKVLFAGKNCSSYVEYLRATGLKLPAILFIIDNYSPFREKLYKYEERIISIISAGKAYGVIAIITGNSRNAIYYKVCEHISAFYTLRMNDCMNYRDILNTLVPIEPEKNKGRGLALIGENVVEFQTALAVEGENEAERVQTICRKYMEYAESWKKQKPIKLGVVATAVDNQKASAPQNSVPLPISRNNPPEPIEDTPHTLVVGNSPSGVVRYGINLMTTKTLFIGSKSKDETNAYLSFLMPKISEYGKRQIILIDNGLGSAQHIQTIISGLVYIGNSNSFGNLVFELEKMIEIRRANYNELASAGLSPEVIYGNLVSFEKTFIVIYDFQGFYDMITDEDAEKFTRLIKDSHDLGIYFITVGNLETLGGYNQAEMYIYLIKAKDGMILSGSIEPQYAGLLCDEMINIAVSFNAKAKDRQSLFYANGKYVAVTY